MIEIWIDQPVYIHLSGDHLSATGSFATMQWPFNALLSMLDHKIPDCMKDQRHQHVT